jgi:gamma-glutamyltranspeptidase/glutathione hydrolase
MSAVFGATPFEFTPPRTYRPTFQGRKQMVVAGHYLAGMAGNRILEAGGNAVDAGVATGICINVLQPDMTSFGGVAPMVIYLADRREVVTIGGLGRWPKKASTAYFKENFEGRIPSGVLRTVTPAAAYAWLMALEMFGTMSFAEVVAPALEMCEEGFPIHQFIYDNLTAYGESIRKYPSNLGFFDGDQPRPVGELLKQPMLANTFHRLIAAEASAGDREGGLRAARDLFYKGDIAREIVAFNQENGGLLDYEDLAEFTVKLEPAATTTYRDYEVFACGPWTQGPVLPQALNILEGYPLRSLGHNSPEYLHLVISALDAAFADRHQYYGDPDFVQVPMDGLMSKAYAATWRERIAMDSAWADMPTPGDPWQFERELVGAAGALQPATGRRSRTQPDTSYCAVVDRWGNGFSATPSDGIVDTAMIPSLGLIASSRGSQSWVDESHPAAIQGGKRPRLTPSPALALKDGELAMVFGSPGNDVQPQAMAQVLINMIDFGMDPQAAIEAPRAASYNYPASSFPHPYHPGTMNVEGRIPSDVRDALTSLGHTVKVWPDWIATAGAPCVIQVDREHGTLQGGADPRRMSYVVGW